MTDRHEAAGAAGMSPAMRQTAMFLLGGFGLLLVGSWLNLRPTLRQRATLDVAEAKVLFPDLTDADKAGSLEIVSFDDETATLKPFKVAKSGGVWVLPMHENYPADAKDQLAAAATELIDRPILEIVSTSPGDHETYGVIEPDPEKVKVGMTGVGQLVEIRDASGNKLARLIVGKEDKRPGNVAPGGRVLRFVRRAGQDAVYRVELDTAKFTTKFDDWIEKDLLKLSPWDVRRLVIDDSTCTFGVDEQSGRLMVSQDRKSRISLAYDDKDAKWSLVKLEGFDKDKKPKEESLPADEELASGKLNDLRNALGDLKIVDVVRKPSGLSADLKAEESFTGNREAVQSLAQRGFFPFQSGEILSSNGETVVGMKDGVEYLLRFGNGTTIAAADEKPAEENAAPASSTGRYLFVMARFNESLLQKPTLEPLPEVPAVPGDAKKDAAQGDAAKDAAKEPDAKAPDAKPDGPKSDAAEELKKAEDAEAKAQAALEERRRVEGENRRREEDYAEQVKKAQKRVQDLNARFADWYYVVSDAEYAKIRLGRGEVIQKKPADEKPEAKKD